MRFYYVLGRLMSPLHSTGFYVYNMLFRTQRARVLVWNEQGQLLLVQNWAGTRQWGLPGGGVERGETSAEAARRELFEEIGLQLPLEQFTYVGMFTHKYAAPIYEVTIKSSALPKKPHNPREIVALEWFSLDSLPSPLSPLVPLALKGLSKTADI